MIDLEMGSRTQARRLWALAGAVVLVAVALGALALPRGAEAADLYLAPGYFAGGLTSASSWEEILRTPGVVSDFPAIGFEVRSSPSPARVSPRRGCGRATPRSPTRARPPARVAAMPSASIG